MHSPFLWHDFGHPSESKLTKSYSWNSWNTFNQHTKSTMFSIPSLTAMTCSIFALSMFRASSVTTTFITFWSLPFIMTNAFTILTATIWSTINIASFYKNNSINQIQWKILRIQTLWTISSKIFPFTNTLLWLCIKSSVSRTIRKTTCCFIWFSTIWTFPSLWTDTFSGQTMSMSRAIRINAIN